MDSFLNLIFLIKKSYVLLFVLLLNSCFFIDKKNSADTSKFNVVFISIDNLRADHMGLYGYARDTTPNLDIWAKNAQIFEKFYSSTPMTVTSEGSVFTGRYPFENGLISFSHSFFPQIKTLTAILFERGYKTLAYGNSPEYRNYPSIQNSFKPFFNTYKIHGRIKRDRKIEPSVIKKFLDNIGTNNFFIWLPMGTIHSPFGYPFKNKFSDKNYKGPLKFLEKNPTGFLWIYKNILYPIIPETNFFTHTNKGQELLKNSAKIKKTLKTEDLNWIKDRYDDGIHEFDKQFANIMAEFEKKDLIKKTIFILYSNHGEELNEHGYYGHFDIYQGNVHVPLIIKSPTLPTAARHKTLASSIDILPTLLQMLNIKSPSEVDGLNLFSEVAKTRNHIFIARTPLWESLLRTEKSNTPWDEYRKNISQEKHMGLALITDQYKLIHRRERFVLKKYSLFQYISGNKITVPEYELYDIKNDPFEQNNLADSSAEFPRLQSLLSEFEKNMINKNKNKKFIKDNNIQDYQ